MFRSQFDKSGVLTLLTVLTNPVKVYFESLDLRYAVCVEAGIQRKAVFMPQWLRPVCPKSEYLAQIALGHISLLSLLQIIDNIQCWRFVYIN